MLFYDYFTSSIFDHFNCDKLELNKSSVIYQNPGLSIYHGHCQGRMKSVTVHTIHGEVTLHQGLIVWLYGEVSHSRERVNQEYFYKLEVSTGYFACHSLVGSLPQWQSLFQLCGKLPITCMKVHSCHAEALLE